VISEWDNAQAQRPPKVAASAIVDWCTGEAEIVVRFPDYALYDVLWIHSIFVQAGIGFRYPLIILKPRPLQNFIHKVL